MARLKTGTPPRLDGRTIDWGRLEEQPSDAEAWTMCPMAHRRAVPQLFCAVTRTNERTHDIIRSGLDRSPLFGGDIAGAGPRYCPSIEDKIHRFGDRDGHQIFLEPEGLSDHLVYPNGISTSLPVDVQWEMLRSMRALERVEIVHPGYAVEYDHIDPRALDHGLQVGAIPGLYCAGQINGTTGYEEAAAQGLVAGLAAAADCNGRKRPALDRANSYIAVMVDDLVLQGVSEPYRMLTARAEYRLRLRADNAWSRLTPVGLSSGCVRPDRERWYYERAARKRAFADKIDKPLSSLDIGDLLVEKSALAKRASGRDVLRQPDTHARDLLAHDPAEASLLDELTEDIRYEPYLARQDAELRDLRSSEGMTLPERFDYRTVAGLSNEMVELLQAAKPRSLGEAGRIRGITPAALSAILVASRRDLQDA